jgi:ADP-ribose pyrophosphatase YjhB (NUDIX family)
MDSKISTKYDTPKDSAAVFVVYDGKILLKRYMYEGIWCCGAVLGKFIEEGEDPIQELIKIEKDQLGIDLPPRYICTITSYINKPKPDGRVRLISPIYLLEIDENSKKRIKKDKDLVWLDADAVSKSEEIRDDDKLIFEHVLEGNYKNQTMDVDQMGKWGRPKLLAWFED